MTAKSGSAVENRTKSFLLLFPVNLVLVHVKLQLQLLSIIQEIEMLVTTHRLAALH